MTPAGPLVVFCVVLAAIAAGRVVLEDDSDPIDAGTALLVLGITGFATLWLLLEAEWDSTADLALVAAGSGLLVLSGLAVLVRYWETPTTVDDTCEHSRNG
ncbi:hypothetical protein [Halopiger goleimassiliensis]|uniref:hypothetical protein n=1 Tax=Halopiger goleimassiliensis TaxID=1293048 RepID=UPI000677903F|nr:hypothetical protein [Halopiger goleimassiliensis]